MRSARRAAPCHLASVLFCVHSRTVTFINDAITTRTVDFCPRSTFFTMQQVPVSVHCTCYAASLHLY